MEYKAFPHDIVNGERVSGLSASLSVPLVETGREFLNAEGQVTMINAGSSAEIDLPTKSVDLVITDPPFFNNNVHYSELADFFHVWLAPLEPYKRYPHDIVTTRSTGEVQHTDAPQFEAAIAAVWEESARVFKDDGLLAFTFPQSKPEGWIAVIKALRRAKLEVTGVQPVKAEMSTASPKSAASDPSNLDAVVVCRHRGHGEPPTVERAQLLLFECKQSGTTAGYADVQSVVRGTVLARHTWNLDDDLTRLYDEASQAADRVCASMGITSGRSPRPPKRP